jgi:hypothetical protein
MADRYRVIVRRTGRTEKSRFGTLAEALDALETELRAAATVVRGAPTVKRALGREYEPAQQVAVRGELRGPGGLRAGVDVRGDGSMEAFTGQLLRRPVEARDREDAWSALRRVVASDGG